MHDVADELRNEVAEAVRRLQTIPDIAASEPRAEGKWSRTEILGHLVDSAFNNLHRFVRAQLTSDLSFPGYEQDEWVARQGYRDRAWSEVIDTWRVANHHLAHAIERIPETARAHIVRIGDDPHDPPTTLEWWVRDYLRHLRHHLAQILE
jgi:hypothetical protein